MLASPEENLLSEQSQGPQTAPGSAECVDSSDSPSSLQPSTADGAGAADDAQLENLLHQIHELTGHALEPQGQPDSHATEGGSGSHQAHGRKEPLAAVPSKGQSRLPETEEFFPREPRSFAEAKLTESEVEGLLLKYLLSIGDSSGHQIADQLALPFPLIDGLLRQLKQDRMVVFQGSAPMNDYIYRLTDIARERGKRLSEECTYYGAAPVCLKDYVQSVAAQSLQCQHPTQEDLCRAFEDLLINQKMFDRLGPAINSGRGLFLFGSPGNGKTSIAERITRCFGETIWIPKALGIDGEVVRLYDPNHHEEVPPAAEEGILQQVKADRRWLRVRRPTVVVGGELTMDNLEATRNSSGITEAPFQLKANCGTLVIDDFGRQRMSIMELLNRWIVPLEKRYDILNLANGKKIEVPFDQLIVFSTNLEPRDLVDDAFLRRIPYKIEVLDPTEEEFRELFKLMCPIVGLPYNQEAVEYLINTHYKAVNRPYRCCQPRDLLQQIRNNCHYQGNEPAMTPDFLDQAVANYFAVM